MLTTDLARATVRHGVLHPRWVDAAKPELEADAQAIIEVFAGAVGDTVGEIEEALEATLAGRPEVILLRGLAKLCWDASTVESPRIATRSDPDKVVTPQEIRATLFPLAAERWPVRPEAAEGFTPRAEVVAEAAARLDITPEEVERGLYADLASAQHLLDFRAMSPRELLERYNLALAQACLLRAREVRLDLPGLEPKRAQALFRALKFRRLLFRFEPRPEGPRVVLDGPLSLFKQTSRYGLQLALFLPELLFCERFTLEAEVRWGKADKDVVLKLSERSPLTARGRDKGTWTSAEEAHFVKSFEALDTPWRLAAAAELIDLDGRDALCPDYVLSHPDGRRAFLELVFAWRRKTFARRAELLAEAGPRALVVALAERGRADDEGEAALPEALAVYRFKGVIQPKRVLDLAERVAERPPTPPRAPRAPVAVESPAHGLTPRRRKR